MGAWQGVSRTIAFRSWDPASNLISAGDFFMLSAREDVASMAHLENAYLLGRHCIPNFGLILKNCTTKK